MIQSQSLLKLDAWRSALVAVDSTGTIAWVEPGPILAGELQDVCSKHGWDITDPASSIQVIEGHEGEWLMPGLVDTHSVSLILISDHLLRLDPK